MRRSLFLTGMFLLSSLSPAAIAANSQQKEAPRLIETSVTPEAKVVAVQPVVEKLNAGNSAKPRSPCSAPIDMDAATARALVEKIARQEDFYPEFVLAVAHGESRFDPNALSPKGAVGLMQLEPATAERYKVNICDPADNVRGGVRFLRDLHARYKNPLFILAAYNAGEETLQQYHGVPPYPETVRFVATVLNEFYEWPSPERKSRPPAAARGRAPKSDPTLEGAVSSREAGDGRWQSGFVWNVQ
ncbi:MAG: lytic transglycosylase domain-containing protein [Methylocystis sp.]